MFPVCRKAVSILKYTSKLKVAAECDGASTNREFYRMHIYLNSNDTNGDIDIFYKVKNINSGQEMRFLLGDPLHIVNTVSNYLES